MAENLEVRLVHEQAELRRVYRTRYEVYVEELGWPSHYANPQTRTLTDSLDFSANIFAAFRGGEVLGTLRTHHSNHADFGPYLDLYDLRAVLRAQPHSIAIATMFMVDKASRFSRVTSGLIVAAVKKALSDGIRQVFIECEFSRVPFYKKLGFEIHRPVIHHPEYGSGACLCLVLENCTLFKRIAGIPATPPPAPDALSLERRPT